MSKILGIAFLAFLFACDIAVADTSEKVAKNMFLAMSKTISESCKSGDRNSCKALEETISRCHGDKSELCDQLRSLEMHECVSCDYSDIMTGFKELYEEAEKTNPTIGLKN